MKKLRYVIFAILILLLLYTRFIHLGWGLPYPFHPDERNMAVAIQNLHCSTHDCFNPHFFAYGQLPLYAAYFGIVLQHFLSGQTGQPITYIEATMTLRLISALASILNVLVLIKILEVLLPNVFKRDRFFLPSTLLPTMLFLIFSPYSIQFSHFGTTESLLMLLYSLVIFFSLKFIASYRDIFLVSFFSGLAIATKISSGIFAILPVIAIISKLVKGRHFNIQKNIVKHSILYVLCLGIVTAMVAILFSPYNLLALEEFKNSISYESAVATGALHVFYTRQFDTTVPLLFQLQHVFPYVLGWPMYILSICGFFMLPYTKKYNILRLAFGIYFVPSAFLYAKWARFMAPILPVLSLFGILFLFEVKKWLTVNHKIHIILSLIVIISIIPGIAYLSIYQQPDVRFQASNWIYKHIPGGSHILSETANVVDIPMPSPHGPITVPQYQVTSFNFYDVDTDPVLQSQLQQEISLSDYIFIPSRRIVANLHCDTNCQYPIVANYYQRLFDGSLGFKQVAEFSSYPKISFFGKTLLEFPDEQAEETWTVFDHPVIRIYKRS
jgi:hypothetical protein